MDSEFKPWRNVISSATKLAKEMINGQFSPLSNNAWKLKATIWEEAKGGYICLQNQPYYLKAIHNIYSKEENFVSSSDTLFFWHHGVKRKTTASPVQ